MAKAETTTTKTATPARADGANLVNTDTAAPRTAQDAPAAATPTVTTPAPAEAAKPEVTKEQGKILFGAYETADADLEKAEAAVIKAKGLRSDSIEAIVNAYGHPGPFRRGGKLLTAAKVKGGGYTFRGERQRDVEEV